MPNQRKWNCNDFSRFNDFVKSGYDYWEANDGTIYYSSEYEKETGTTEGVGDVKKSWNTIAWSKNEAISSPVEWGTKTKNYDCNGVIVQSRNIDCGWTNYRIGCDDTGTDCETYEGITN